MVSVTQVRMRRIGGSLAVTIPKNIVNAEDIHEDEVVEVTIKKTKKSYRGIYKGELTSFTKEDKFDTHEDYP